MMILIILGIAVPAVAIWWIVELRRDTGILTLEEYRELHAENDRYPYWKKR